MKEAALLLHQALQQMAKLSRGDRPDHGVQQALQQARSTLADSAAFQTLLADRVPVRWRDLAQQRLLNQLYRCTEPEQLSVWCAQQLTDIVVSLQTDAELCDLIQQICDRPKRDTQRRKLITQLIVKMQATGKITTHITNLSPELYQDALSETWLWFCENLAGYDPARSGPISWFNRNLFYTASRIRRSHYRHLPHKFKTSEENRHREGGPNAYEPLLEEAERQILDDLYEWVQCDPQGYLKRTALRDRLDINCQTTIKAVLDHIQWLHRLHKVPARLNDLLAAQPTSLTDLFAALALRWNCPPERLRRFWREQCRLLIDDFLQQSGSR